MSRHGDPVSNIKIVDVVICRLRRKLRPHNIAIVTIHGQGFQLAKDARDRIRRILAEHGEDLISAATPPVDQANNAVTGGI
jgi:DNA-binding winged helix-turn-helix (wHTH) protein